MSSYKTKRVPHFMKVSLVSYIWDELGKREPKGTENSLRDWWSISGRQFPQTKVSMPTSKYCEISKILQYFICCVISTNFYHLYYFFLVSMVNQRRELEHFLYEEACAFSEIEIFSLKIYYM